jgi:O-antigen/teichoic acid export membrane protein
MSKIIDKLRNKHFLALAGNAMISVLGIATLSLLAHFLTKTDVGKWFVFLSLVSICDALRNGFLGTATIKFYAGTEPGRGAAVLGSVWFLATALTAAILLINGGAMLLLPYIHNDGLSTGIKWFGITFLSSLPFSVIYWKLQADEEYGKMLWLKMVNSGSTIIVFIVLVFLKKLTLETALLYNFLTNCLTSAVGIFWNMARLKTITSRSRECIMELVHYGKYSLGTTLSSTLLRSTDTFIITFMLGPAAVAIFNLPVRLMEIVEMPLRSFVGTGMSGMAVAFNQKNMHQVTYILKKYAGMLTMAFIPLAIGAFFFADLAISVMWGNKYAGTEAANIYRLFMLFCLIAPIDRFNGATLDIIHQPKINFYKVILMLVVNVVADFTALAIFKNLYAVVIAGFITNLCGFYFGYYHLRKYVDYSIGGVLTAGFQEMKSFLQKQLKLAPGS